MVQPNKHFVPNPEADEVTIEDLEAAAEKLDDIEVNPAKYFTKPKDRKKIIASLEKAARSLIDQSEKINTDISGAWTRKRQAQADSNERKKERLIKWAIIMNTLAMHWLNNDVPESLSKIRTISDLEYLFHGYFPDPLTDDHPIDGWFRKEYPKLLKKAKSLGINSKEEKAAIIELLKSYSTIVITQEEINAQLLREELKKVHTYNIPGFFPTPDDLIDIMLSHAEIRSGMRILEPSAGIGSIADMIRDRYPNCFIHCVEMQHSLTHILRLKGFQTTGADIMGLETNEVQDFDRIIMNPPFERGQDMDHVRRCFDRFLRPGGILVSIVSSGSITGDSMKHRDFKAFRERYHAYHVDNGRAFKDAFNSTGVSSVILVVEKPLL